MYLAIVFCICYNAVRQMDKSKVVHLAHQNETPRETALRVSCSFPGNQSEASCHVCRI